MQRIEPGLSQEEMFGKNWFCIKMAKDEDIIRIRGEIDVYYSHKTRTNPNASWQSYARKRFWGAPIVFKAPAAGAPVHDALGA